MVLLILVGLAFILGVAIVLGGYFGVTQVPGMMLQRKLEARLVEVSKGPELGEGAKSDGKVKALLKTREVGPLPVIDRIVGESERGSALARWIDQSGVKTSISAVLLGAVICAMTVGFLLSMVVRSSWGMIVGGAIGFSVPFVVLNIKRTRRLRKFEEEFPEALDLIARALKAGHAFNTGLKMVADEMHEPIGPEFRKTFDEQNFGLPLKDALENLTNRVPLLDVRFFATAVMIQRETGGNLSEILENLGHVVRERFKILRQVRVHTAHGRLTGYVLLALPAFLGIALAFINPDHMNLLFREQMGHMLLLTAVVMQTVGYLWIRQVVKIEV
ncbi:MAG TPA: type II secretion system F family protein [Vicinamibacterales bacterium]|nr:type II secretion system F family protein [Vicinamibacterales bacterium]